MNTQRITARLMALPQRLLLAQQLRDPGLCSVALPFRLVARGASLVSLLFQRPDVRRHAQRLLLQCYRRVQVRGACAVLA